MAEYWQNVLGRLSGLNGWGLLLLFAGAALAFFAGRAVKAGKRGRAPQIIGLLITMAGAIITFS